MRRTGNRFCTGVVREVEWTGLSVARSLHSSCQAMIMRTSLLDMEVIERCLQQAMLVRIVSNKAERRSCFSERNRDCWSARKDLSACLPEDRHCEDHVRPYTKPEPYEP